MALTAQEEAVVKALAKHANLSQFSSFMDALTPQNWANLVMAVTDAVASRNAIQKTTTDTELTANLKAAQVAYNDAEARWLAARQAVQAQADAAIHDINVEYTSELNAARAALDAAKAALE